MAKKTTADRLAQIKKAKGSEPVIESEGYQTSLIKYLNYHSKNSDDKAVRHWAIEYQTKQDKSVVKFLSKATDAELRPIGVLGRAIDRGDPVGVEEITQQGQRIQALVEKYSQVEEPKTTKKASTKVPELPPESPFIAEAEAAIDDFVVSDKEFSMKEYLAANEVKPTVAKAIGRWFGPTLEELKEAYEGSCPQLKEAYAYLGRVKLRKLMEFVERIILDCSQQVVTQRKPRVRKEKPPAVLAKDVNYKLEDVELDLKSVHPSKLVGAKEAWVFNTKTRKLIVYKATQGETLTVKGTTVLGFDVSTSTSKTIRKPEIIKDFVGMTKTTFAQAYKKIRSKEAAVKGRLNNDCLIVKVV